MTDIFQYDFFRNALAGLLIISVASALIGTYIVSRRLVALCGGITHACFGGLGLGYFLGISPLLMAGVFAVGSTAGVEWLSSRQNMREDSAIAVVWSLGMALGILFVFMTPGYVPELTTFLFGNVLTITRSDLIAFALFTVVLLIFFALFYRMIVACAFDRDFALVSNLPVRFINYTMTVLVAVCIVLTIRLVGIMLLMSMLTLPQLCAEVFTNRFPRLMALSALFSVLASAGGLFAATLVDVPCSALIVVAMVSLYVVARIAKALSRNISRSKAVKQK